MKIKNHQRNLKNTNFQTKVSIVDVLTSQTTVLILGNVFNVLAYVALSWLIIPIAELMVWTSLFFVLLVTRTVFNMTLRGKFKKMSTLEIDRCFGLFSFGAFLSGAFWGVLGYWYTQSSVPIHHTATIFIIAGVTSGAAAIYSVWQPLVRSFLLPALLPLGISLAVSGGVEGVWMALLVLFYLVSLLSYSQNYGEKIVDGIQLNLENRSLENRLNVVSHELKNPVSSIIGYSELLQKKDWSNKEDLKYLTLIKDNAWEMKSMVDLILADSENDNQSGKPRLSIYNRLDLDREVKALGDNFGLRLQRKGIWIETYGFDMVPSSMFLDIKKFRLVLGNLIDNSIKYSSESSISIVADYDNISHCLYINIEDRGIGMSPKSIGKLFEPFFRENRPEVLSQEGSGLGLGLSRKIARSLGGDLKVLNSQLGEGSVFEFSMKVETAESRLVSKMEGGGSRSAQLKGKKIVLVEDCMEVGYWIQCSLEKHGADVQSFESSRDALSYFAHGKNIDFLITDICMPNIDGFELARKFREAEFMGLIYGLSFFVEGDLRKRSGARNFDDFLCKSMSVEEQVRRLVAGELKKKVS